MKPILGLLLAGLCWSQTSQIGPARMVGPAQQGGAAGAITHTFTNVQRANSDGNCGGATTCSVTVASTGAGHAGLLYVVYLNGAQQTISSITCSPTACTGANAWTIPAAATAFEVNSWDGAAAAWNCNIPAGVTSITVTMSATISLTYGVYFEEYSYTGGGTCSQDDAQGNVQATGATSITGITPTLTGSSDLIVQGISSELAGPTGVTTYTNLQTGVNVSGTGDLINSSTTTAPVWSFAGSNRAAMAEIALK